MAEPKSQQESRELLNFCIMTTLTSEEMFLVSCGTELSKGCGWAIASMCVSCMSACLIGNVAGLIGWGVSMAVSGGGLIASCRE